jgi:hypothetical protein
MSLPRRTRCFLKYWQPCGRPDDFGELRQRAQEVPWRLDRRPHPRPNLHRRRAAPHRARQRQGRRHQSLRAAGGFRRLNESDGGPTKGTGKTDL